MTSNAQAQKKVMNGLRDLVLIKYNSKPKTAAQIASIDNAVDRLNDELLRLRGIPVNASYADIASNIAAARADLEKVIADRKALADTLVTVGKILGSIRSVLSLIA